MSSFLCGAIDVFNIFIYNLKIVLITLDNVLYSLTTQESVFSNVLTILIHILVAEHFCIVLTSTILIHILDPNS